MNKSIETIQFTRKIFLELINVLSIDELNKIPAGFNNNIIWNLGHINVSQQILCYKLSGLPLKIDETFVTTFSKGTKPEKFFDENECMHLKEQTIKLINDLTEDLKKGLFTKYNSYKTSFGIELNKIEDAVKFITMHDGLHLGYSMALKRAI